MLQNKIVVLSDIHIGTNTKTNWYQKEVHEPYLITALDYVINQADSIQELILLGDLVDFWTYPPREKPPTFADVVESNPNIFGPDGKMTKVLFALKGRVTFVPGNHDMGVTQESLNLIHHPDAYPLKLAPSIYYPLENNKDIACTHGHLYSMLCSDDENPGNKFAPLPLGYFVTRTVAAWFENKLKDQPEKTVADFSNVGTPFGADFNDLAIKGFITSIAKGIIQGLSLAKLVLDPLAQAGGMTDTQPIVLSDGTITNLGEVKKVYDYLLTNWVLKKGMTEASASLFKADFSEDLSSFAADLASQNRSKVIIMGHTHAPSEQLISYQSGSSNFIYTNSGFNCPSIPDIGKKHPTFVEIEFDDSSYKVNVREIVNNQSSYSIAPLLGPLTVNKNKRAPSIIGKPLTYTAVFKLMGEDGKYFTRMEEAFNGAAATTEYYPRLSSDANSFISLRLVKGAITDIIYDGDLVFIQTLENSVGNYNLLGAWSTPALYYYKEMYDNEKWIIRKADASQDNIIHYGDAVYFVNVAYEGQVLIPRNEQYLTTAKENPFFWYCEEILSQGSIIKYGDTFKLFSSDRQYVTNMSEEYNAAAFTTEYYPKLSSNNNPINLKLAGKDASYELISGNVVQIQTTESTVKDYNLLGAWSTPSLYYYKPGYEQQNWVIRKVDAPDGTTIRYGDCVYIFNQHFNQYLAPNGDYLTTTGSGCKWFLIQ